MGAAAETKRLRGQLPRDWDAACSPADDKGAEELVEGRVTEKRAFTGADVMTAPAFVAPRRASLSKLRKRVSTRLRRMARQDKPAARLRVEEDDDRKRKLQAAPRAQDIARYAEMAGSADLLTQLEGVVQIRKLLQLEHDAPIQRVVDSGVVPRLVTLLECDTNPRVQLESGWALTNVASGTSFHTKAVVDAGAVPRLVALLESPEDSVRDQAVWALGNISGDSAEFRDAILERGALHTLVNKLMTQHQLSEKALENATWTMLNLIRSKPSPAFSKVACALPRVLQLLHSPNLAILKDACWAAAAMTDNGDAGCVRAVIDSGIVQRCIDLAGHEDQRIMTPALRTVGNSCTGSDIETQDVIDGGAVPVLARLAEHSSKLLRKEACWTLSNITAGNSRQVQAVFDAGVVSVLVRVIRDDVPEVAKEAVWAVANATAGGTPAQLAHMVVDHQCVIVLCECLDRVDPQDSFVQCVALEGLENMIRVLGSDQTKVAAQKALMGQVEVAALQDLASELAEHDWPSVSGAARRILELLARPNASLSKSCIETDSTPADADTDTDADADADADEPAQEPRPVPQQNSDDE